MSLDISNEKSNYVYPGVQHKYKPTLTVICCDNCLKRCDWCFRKRFYLDRLSNDKVASIDKVVDYVAEHKEIKSILFTGGDSFLADSKYMMEMIIALNQFDHITSYRFGTRAVVLDHHTYFNLTEVLSMASRKTVYIMLHIVHPDEITKDLKKITLTPNTRFYLSQVPLLKSINNDYEILSELFIKMEQIRISPYYIFQCRYVDGNKKYMVTLDEGYELMRSLKRRLSGVSKRFKYVMSTDEGKLEIVGKNDLQNVIYLSYHQARDEKNLGYIIPVNKNAVWMRNGQPIFIRK